MPQFRARYALLMPAIVVAFFCGCTARIATAQSDQALASVSFELYHNRVYLPVEVDGRVVTKMILDTGAADSGLSESVAQGLNLKFSGTAQLVGNGESNQKVALARNVRFNVGGAELVEKTTLIIPFSSIEAREGRAVAGVLGVSLFRKYVVVLDYQRKQLSLFAPGSFVYHGSGDVIPLHFAGAALLQADIRLRDGRIVPAQLGIDLGTYSALRLYPRFAQQNGILADPKIPSISSFGFGIGGEFPETLVRVDDLKIGELGIRMPFASISNASHGATAISRYDGTIGGAILRRFTVTLDYSRSRMILEPNADFAAPFHADTSGLVLSASGPNFKTISISHVIPNTPAAAADIREGDVLLAVDGADAGSLGLEQIRLFLCRPGSYRLRFQRASKDVSVNLTTRDLVP